MNEPSHERQLETILHAYLQAVDAGDKPDRADLLRKHPDLADELRNFFADQEKMDGFVKSMHKVQVGDPTIGTDGSPDGPTDLPRIRYIGDYELLEVIARGGMGVVYKARQVTLNRVVALKMILAGQLASAGDVERFKTEAEAAGGLDHPNIVPIYEVGEFEGQHYFSMKLVEGGNLTSFSKEPKATSHAASTIARLIATIARAVHHAHQRGILHRDLKPANILLDDKGQPNITDFGLAKRVEGTSGMTQSGAIVGTPGYMAPEQVRAERQLTTAVDVYGLGAILYELLTGRPPFQAKTPFDTLKEVLERDPAQPRSLRPTIDRDLETICLKCLRKEPAQRYASASELADELERYARGEPILARPVGNLERTAKWVRRNPLVAGLSAAAFLALVGGTVVSTLFAVGEYTARQAAMASAAAEKEAREDADKKAALAKSNALLAETRAELARRNAYSAQISQIETLWKLGDQTDLANALLKRLEPSEGESDLRGWEWYHFWSLGHAGVGSLPVLPNGWRAAAFSPDGKRVVALGDRGRQLKVINIADGTEALKLDFSPGSPGSEVRIVFARKGDIVALAGGNGGGFSNNELWVWNLPENRQIGHFKEQSIYGIALSPDGRFLAAHFVNRAKIWDLTEGREPRVFDESTSGMVFSPDSKLLTFGAGTAWDVTTGERASAPLDKVRGQFLATSNDNKLIATLSGNQLRVWDIEQGAVKRAYKSSMKMVRQCIFSPDSKRLVAFELNLGGSPRVELWNLEEKKEARRLNMDQVWALGFSPDSQQLYGADLGGGIKVWNVAEIPNPRILGGHKGGVNSVVFSSDSKQLFSADDGGTVRAWDVETGKENRRFEGQKGVVKALALSADGKRLASAGRDGYTILWDLPSGTIRRTIKNTTDERFAGGPAQYVDIAFHTDCKKIALVKDVLNGEVELLDVTTGQSFGKMGGSQCAFSPDGRWLATANAIMWDKTGRIMTPGNPIKIWDSTSLTEKTELRGNLGLVFKIAFSKESGELASAGEDKTARLWDINSGKQLFELKGHTNQVMSVAFSPDGTRLATASQDRSVKLWDTQTGQPLITLDHAPRGVQALWLWDVAFSPDGRWLAASSQDGTISLWDGQNPVSMSGGKDAKTEAVPRTATSGKQYRQIVTDKELIQGLWQFSGTASDGKAAEAQFFFKDDSVYTLDRNEKKNTSEGTYKLDSSKNPKHIDIIITTPVEKSGTQLVRGLYELDGNTLKLCLPPPGKERPNNMSEDKTTEFRLIILKKAN
jgi:eukaryotic-like serine/threonine-protein kinase